MGVYPENSTLIPLLWRGGAQHRGGPIRDSFAPELTGHEPPRPERAPLEECDHPALTGTPRRMRPPRPDGHPSKGGELSKLFCSENSHTVPAPIPTNYPLPLVSVNRRKADSQKQLCMPAGSSPWFACTSNHSSTSRSALNKKKHQVRTIAPFAFMVFLNKSINKKGAPKTRLSFCLAYWSFSRKS